MQAAATLLLIYLSGNKTVCVRGATEDTCFGQAGGGEEMLQSKPGLLCLNVTFGINASRPPVLAI